MFIDEKVTIWRRTYLDMPDDITVETIKKDIELDQETIENLMEHSTSTEYIMDAIEFIDPSENAGDSTLGIYADEQCFWENGRKGTA